jgi:nicotinamide mononucleotide transporter
MFADLLRSIASQVTLLEGTAVLFGLVSVWLSTREKIWSWPTAIINVGLYSVLFFREKLYADMGLQVVYLVLSVYGWYEWLYGGENRTALRVSRLDARTAAVLGAVGVAGSMALGTFLGRSTDASLPFLDSTLSVFSLIAQWMMTRKILENWVLWIALDVVYVWMFVALKDLNFTAFQYSIFLILAVMGYRDWKRSYERRHTLATV